MKKLRITEKMLLNGYIGITNGLSNISIVDNQKYYWIYRKDDGYYQPMTDRARADYIAYRVHPDAVEKRIAF